jgi:hypothetical protein
MQPDMLCFRSWLDSSVFEAGWYNGLPEMLYASLALFGCCFLQLGLLDSFLGMLWVARVLI